MNFRQHLIDLGACQDAIDWVGNKTLDEAWKTCERADWMLWLTGKHVGENGWMTERELRLEACFCAEYALQFSTPKHRDILANTISVARAFADSKATQEELAAAWSVAWSAARSAAWRAAESAARSAAERGAAPKILADSIRVRYPKIGVEND